MTRPLERLQAREWSEENMSEKSSTCIALIYITLVLSSPELSCTFTELVLLDQS